MARRSSGGGGRSGPRPAARPTKTPSKPAPMQSGNGIGSAIREGFGLGAGMSIANRAVDAIFGPRVIQHETIASPEPAVTTPAPNMNNVANSDACGGHSKALIYCLNSYGSDISKCQFYMDMLQECRRGPGASLGA